MVVSMLLTKQHSLSWPYCESSLATDYTGIGDAEIPSVVTLENVDRAANKQFWLERPEGEHD